MPIYRGDLSMKSPVADDSKIAWEWKNDPEVRFWSGNTKEVLWDDHQLWFNKIVSGDESNRVVRMVFNQSNQPVGIILAFLRPDLFWQVDYRVAPDCREQGIGRKMVRQFVEALLPSQAKLCFPIIKGNIRSEKIAMGLGLYPGPEQTAPSAYTDNGEKRTIREWVKT